MRFPYILLTTAYCLAILYISVTPNPPQPERQFPHMDKAAHFVMYAGMAAVVAVGLRRSRPDIAPRLLFWAPVAYATAFGAMCEVLQGFVPERTLSYGDMAANAAGALTAQLVLCGAVWPWSRPAAREPSGG